MPHATATRLATPPIPLVVPPSVFDDFAWCRSDFLEWRRAGWNATTPLDGSDPARMVFVFRENCPWLPRELARFHAFGLGLEHEWALAPYAIDDATDELHARRHRPGDLLWLAADNLNALFWGLHDWAHFHNHGPFTQPALTEVQCDVSALAWLWLNRASIGLEEADWEATRHQVETLARGRLAAEGVRFETAVFEPHQLVNLSERRIG